MEYLISEIFKNEKTYFIIFILVVICIIAIAIYSGKIEKECRETNNKLEEIKIILKEQSYYKYKN